MRELPSNEEVEDAKKRGRMAAVLTREHYEALLAANFAEDEAFELAENYHWKLIGGDSEEE